MIVKGRYQKQVFRVGISEDRPLHYRDADEKYVLADIVSQADSRTFVIERRFLEVVFDITTDEFRRTPDRVRCYQLISAMPDAALSEVEESLRETYDHYVTLAAVQEQPLLPAPRVVEGIVQERLRS